MVRLKNSVNLLHVGPVWVTAVTENWIPNERTTLDLSRGDSWITDFLWSEMTNGVPALHQVSKYNGPVADISGLSKPTEGEEIFTGQTIAGLDLPAPVPVG